MAKKSEKMKLVQFTKGHRGYNTGEKATFAPDVADALINAGVANEPGVLEKLAASAAKAAADRKESKRKPEVGRKARFLVPGLGDQTGTILEVPRSGPVKVRVGTEEQYDDYEVERDELIVIDVEE